MATHPISRWDGWAYLTVAVKGPCLHQLPSRDHQESGPPVLVGYDPLAHPQKHQGYTDPGKLVLGTGEVTDGAVCKIHENHGAHSPSGAQMIGVVMAKCS